MFFRRALGDDPLSDILGGNPTPTTGTTTAASTPALSTDEHRHRNAYHHPRRSAYHYYRHPSARSYLPGTDEPELWPPTDVTTSSPPTTTSGTTTISSPNVSRPANSSQVSTSAAPSDAPSSPTKISGLAVGISAGIVGILVVALIAGFFLRRWNRKRTLRLGGRESIDFRRSAILLDDGPLPPQLKPPPPPQMQQYHPDEPPYGDPRHGVRRALVWRAIHGGAEHCNTRRRRSTRSTRSRRTWCRTARARMSIRPRTRTLRRRRITRHPPLRTRTHTPPLARPRRTTTPSRPPTTRTVGWATRAEKVETASVEQVIIRYLYIKSNPFVFSQT
ncbi:hypothetical protein C8J57DRAFT_37536 [Mycena rebaudengoi]|nr:hypothetical protein C8J57DRAFT_37536 [Mycena rebaudengoi]